MSRCCKGGNFSAPGSFVGCQHRHGGEQDPDDGHGVNVWSHGGCEPGICGDVVGGTSKHKPQPHTGRAGGARAKDRAP